MANVRYLQKLVRLQKSVLPLKQQLQRLLPAAVYVTRNYAKDTEQIKDFRAREEQRERERDAAEQAEAKSTQSDAGAGPPDGDQQQQQQTSKEEAEKQAKVDATRAKILDAALRHVPEHGWSKQAIVLGAEECGLPSVVHGMFPEGGFALVSHFNGTCNAQLVKSLQEQTQNGHKEVDNPLEFLVQAVRHRLELILPYKQHWPQAMALNAQPPHASTALAQVLTLVDDICYYSGDRSVDFGWYTRRIGLATIMKMTELFMVQDTSPGHAHTWEFLKNRMDEAVQLQMALAQTEGMTQTFSRSFNTAFVTVSEGVMPLPVTTAQTNLESAISFQARNILGLGYNRH
ncbi:hypothetical protein KR222_010979 [Zaprionus bogoriensis]|nr:hypothetical protein KR222_010979 [Zaprionus bogoriensis]